MRVYRRFICGEVKGLQRPRASSVGRHARVYDTTQNVVEKARIQKLIEWQGAPIVHDGKGITVLANAFFRPPKSFSKAKLKKALDGEINPTKKPDVDNIAKLILDALNSVVWGDDAEVTRIVVTKRYSETEGIDLQIMWEEPEDAQ